MASAVNVSEVEANTSSHVLLAKCEIARPHCRTLKNESFVPVSAWRCAAPPSRVLATTQSPAQTTVLTAEARRHPTPQVQCRPTDIHLLTTRQAIYPSSVSFPAAYRRVDRSELSKVQLSSLGQASSNMPLQRTAPRSALRGR